MLRRQWFRIGAALTLAGSLPVLRAQDTLKAAKIIVGFPAGGAADVVSRMTANILVKARYADSVLVENRTGAGGRIAIMGVKNSQPDGATLLLTPTSTLTLYSHVYKKLSYAPLTDLQPVASMANFVFGLAVGLQTGVHDLAELAVWSKANPGSSSYGSPAAGASPHFIGQALANALAIKLEHVPYRGTAPAVQDVIGGQLAAVAGTLGDLVVNHRAGKLRIIGVSTDKRLASLPDVPTFKEQGVDLVVSESFALFAPAAMPGAVAARVNEALAAASSTPEVAELLSRFEMTPGSMTPAAITAKLKQDIEFWGPVVRTTGFQLDE